MSNQGSSLAGKGWHPPQGKMTTYPSVGRFENDQATTLYIKGSSAKLTESAGPKSMAPYSNHGLLSPQHQSSQQPFSGIVDLRTAPGSEGKCVGISATEIEEHRSKQAAIVLGKRIAQSTPLKDFGDNLRELCSSGIISKEELMGFAQP